MSHTHEMLDAAPHTWGMDRDALVGAIDASADCAQTCTACADACLGEDDVAALRTCIAQCTNCADVCAATARVLARQSHDDALLVQRLLEACVRACTSCAAECARHAAHHAHCAVCAEVCLACERACKALLEEEAFAQLQSLAGG
jgi:hypothetical protein